MYNGTVRSMSSECTRSRGYIQKRMEGGERSNAKEREMIVTRVSRCESESELEE